MIRVYLRKFGKRIVTVILIIGLTSGVGFVSMTFFTLQAIEVEGSGMQVVIDQKKLTRNLLFFPTEKLRTELLSQNPLLGDVVIRKKFPHTLVIAAVPRSPIAHLQTKERKVDIDKEGIVLQESSPDHPLPTLLFDVEPVRTGEKVRDPRVFSGIAILTAFEGIFPIDVISSLDSQSLQVKSGILRIYVVQQSDMKAVATTLQVLLTGFRIKGTLPAVMDLRFSKPVVTF
ncbi:hypothetical protein HYV22_00365 [Candidatus Gottesmanbacteria bacterium]|nr:hypothetical protein [Candidatus Gottesmanbacteria bacterium]